MEEKEINFKALKSALDTFINAIEKSDEFTDLERDGLIQRFEYTFELCWKAIRKLLIHQGRKEVSSSPKPLFRDALEENLIKEIDIWFKYVDARNRTSHTYNEKTALSVFKDVQDFSKHASELLNKLNERIK